MIVIIAIGVVLVIILIFIWVYNRIVTLSRRCDQAFADIDVQLQRIAELLPNLINVLKGSASFEKSTLEKIARAHAELVEALRGDTSQKVRGANRFFGVFYPLVYQLPQYPQLQSIQGFQQVMNEIKVSIDKIAYARQFYNQAVNDYNTFIESFPGVLLAGIMGKKAREYLKLGEEERREIQVSLRRGELTKGLEDLGK